MVQTAKASVSSRPFGKPHDGRETRLFTFSNGCGLACHITDYGGIVTAIRITRPAKKRKAMPSHAPSDAQVHRTC